MNSMEEESFVSTGKSMIYARGFSWNSDAGLA